MGKHYVAAWIVNIAIILMVLLKEFFVLQLVFTLFGAMVIFVIALRCYGNGKLHDDESRGVGRTMLGLAALLACCGMSYSLNCRRSSRPFTVDGIRWAQGVLCQDSSITRKGGTLFNVNVRKVRNDFIEATASENISVYIRDVQYRGIYGDEVEFYGLIKSDDIDLYFAESCSIIKRSPFSSLRARLLASAEKRIMTVTNRFRDDVDLAAKGLAMKLFFARNIADVDDELQPLVSKTGLAFVFALSGMHLNVIASLIRRLLRKRTTAIKSGVVAFVLVTAYFAFASRSASFVRAYLMFLLSFVFPSDFLILLPVAFLLQNIFFPLTVASVSFDYSYLATCGILLLHKPISIALRMCVGKALSRYFSLGLSAVLLSAIAGLSMNGEFVAMSLIIGPIAALLASGFVVLALFLIAFRKSIIFSYVARYLYLAMGKVLELGALSSFDVGWAGYVCVALAVLLVFAVALLRARPETRRSRCD